jgi:phosphatidylglycerol:prolipoprotein diacylglycerol transferase
MAGLAGAQLLYRALHGGLHGLASVGGVWAGLVATWFVARLLRLDPWGLLDVLAPAALLGLAVGRVGCFLGGCCYGRPTLLPWGIVFPELGPPPRHPLQLYSAAVDLCLVFLLPRSGPPGAVARRTCVGWGCARAALELLRDPGATDVLASGWLTLPQVAALLLAAGAAASPRLHLLGPSTMPRPRRTSAHGR